jgi:hypothetical protein
LATPDLASSGFPGRVKKGESYHYALDYRFGELQNIGPNHAFCLLFLMVTIIFAFFYATMGWKEGRYHENQTNAQQSRGKTGGSGNDDFCFFII